MWLNELVKSSGYFVVVLGTLTKYLMSQYIKSTESGSKLRLGAATMRNRRGSQLCVCLALKWCETLQGAMDCYTELRYLVLESKVLNPRVSAVYPILDKLGS